MFSVLIAFIFLIIHSLKKQGMRETTLFFGFGFLFGLIREIIYRTWFKNYSFGQMPLRVADVPLTIIFGWIFTFYLGHALCSKLILIKTHQDYLRLMMACSIFSSVICFSIETLAMYMGWWEVFFETSSYAASDLLAGWFYTTLLFFSIYLLITRKLKDVRTLILPFLLIFLIGIIEIVEILKFSMSNAVVVIIYLILLAIIILLHPYLSIILITLALLFFFESIRVFTTNDTRIIIFFSIEFIFLFLVLKSPFLFETQLIKFGSKGEK